MNELFGSVVETTAVSTLVKLVVDAVKRNRPGINGQVTLSLAALLSLGFTICQYTVGTGAPVTAQAWAHIVLASAGAFAIAVAVTETHEAARNG